MSLFSQVLEITRAARRVRGCYDPAGMADLGRKVATYEDLLAVPDSLTAEILDGELVTMPRPGLRHAAAASALSVDLGNPFQRGRGGPGGWVFLFEPELHLDQDVVVPDLAGWRRPRAPEVSGAFTSVAPDWICEVLSDRTRRIDRMRKLPISARAGVAHVWLLDPVEQLLEVFRRHDGRWLLVETFGGATAVRAEPFEAIELELAPLWSPTDPGDSVDPADPSR